MSVKLGINSLTEAEFVGQKHRTDARLRFLHHALARAASLFLMIWVGSAAVQVRAQDSTKAEPSAKECPDLAGTYEVRPIPWDKFSPHGRRPRVKTTLFATLQRLGDGFTLIWHTRREEFLAAARAQAKLDPRKYGAWLDMVLRDPKLPLPLGHNEATWVNRMSDLGPVFRGVDEPLPFKKCAGGWFLVSGPGRRYGPPDFEGGIDGTRDLEFWLGRDKAGSLSLKVEEHRVFEMVKPDAIYLPPLSIRLSSSARLEKWPVASAQDLAPIRAEELPEGNRPSMRISKCQITGDHEAVFFQRLKVNLPPGVQIENKSSSIYHGRMRPDGICDPTPYTVTVSAPDAAAIAKVADYLRTDPFIRRIDSQESHVLGDGRLWVKFRMMAAP